MYKIGVDLGGTNIAVGVIDAENKIIGLSKRKTNTPRPAKEIFDEVWKKEPLRLLGVRAGKLSEEDYTQLSLLDKDWSKQKKADAAMDMLRMKYGKDAVRRSTFAADENAFAGKLKINKDVLK